MSDDTCQRCHKRTAIAGRTRCGRCRWEQIHYDRDRRARFARKKACMGCGGKRAPKRRYCNPCLRYYRAHATTWRQKRGIKPRVRVQNMPPTYAKIVARLKTEGPAPVHMVAQDLRLHPKSIYVQTARMEKQGLLVRRPALDHHGYRVTMLAVAMKRLGR